MDTRPYETEIIKSTDTDGRWLLIFAGRRDDEAKPLLTPQGTPIMHFSKPLMQEIQAELKAGSPDQMINRFSNYYLLCSQIDEFSPLGDSDVDHSMSKSQIAKLLLEDPLFLPMHPPEEIERVYNLRFVGEFLREEFGETSFGKYLISSPPQSRPIWGKHDYKGPKFIELRDAIWSFYKKASLEQYVVMHSTFHMSGSLTASTLFAYGYATPKEFALAVYACAQEIPDIIDEQEEMLTNLDLIAGHAATMLSYLENSRSVTLDLINQGEGMKTEFKATFKRNLHTGKRDKNIESSALKELVAFLNTLGGNLIIGVNDDGSICGLSQDIFSSKDKYLTHIANQIYSRVGAEYAKYLEYYWDSFEGNTVLRIECSALPNTEEAFLDGELYVRNSAQTVKLNTREAINWRNSRNNFS